MGCTRGKLIASKCGQGVLKKQNKEQIAINKKIDKPKKVNHAKKEKEPLKKAAAK